jgi:hypothetical protein
MDPENEESNPNSPVYLNGVQVIAPNPGKRAELLEINRYYYQTQDSGQL